MTAASRSSSKGSSTSRILTINTEFIGHDGEEKLPRSYAYVFSGDGKLITRELLNEKGSVKVEVPYSEGDQDVRVYVGPDARPVAVEEDDANAQEAPRRKAVLTIDDVLRRGGEGQTFTFKGGSRELAARLELLPDRWIKWSSLGFCVVRGKLLKSMPGPDRPIPYATVEIYEVDPIWILIPKLPIQVIESIRDLLKPPRINPELIRPRFPVPPIPPEPFGVQPLSTPMRLDSRGIALSESFDSAPVNNDVQVLAAIEANPALAELRFSARTASDLHFQQALIANAALTKLLLCLIHPPLVTMTLVATAKTNRCGEFKAVFYKGFYNPDVPDLYFKAKQKIFPFLPPLTIYAPTPIPCYTYWDYVCGTEVTLVSTNPLAVPGGFCDLELAEKGVLVNRIGGTYVGGIHGATGVLGAGITEAQRGLLGNPSNPSDPDRPWGGTLWFQLAFDYDYLNTNGVKYYRMSWARRPADGSIPAAAAFTPINTSITWYKRFSVSLDPLPVPIGPIGVENLYEIQPQSLPVPFWWDTGRGETLYHAILPTDVASVAQGTGWTNALTPAGADQAGKFWIKIELFDNAKNKIDLVAKQVGFWIANSSNVNAQDPADPSAIHDNSYFLALHIDNNRCLAQALAPSLEHNGSSFTADPDCGMLDYPGAKLGTVHVPYVFGHRNGFATWGFGVRRGAGIPVGSENTPQMTPNAAQGSHLETFDATVASMLGTCNAAAYVSTIDVDALATDGSGRLYSYDAWDQFAFGLTPES